MAMRSMLVFAVMVIWPLVSSAQNSTPPRIAIVTVPLGPKITMNVCLSANGEAGISTSDQTISAFEPRSGLIWKTVTADQSWITDCAFDPQMSFVVTVGRSGAKVWAFPDFEQIADLGEVISLALMSRRTVRPWPLRRFRARSCCINARLVGRGPRCSSRLKVHLPPSPCLPMAPASL